MSQDNKTCNCPKGFKESANGTMCLGKFQNKDSAGKKKKDNSIKCSSSSLVELISTFLSSWSL